MTVTIVFRRDKERTERKVAFTGTLAMTEAMKFIAGNWPMRVMAVRIT